MANTHTHTQQIFSIQNVCRVSIPFNSMEKSQKVEKEKKGTKLAGDWSNQVNGFMLRPNNIPNTNGRV